MVTMYTGNDHWHEVDDMQRVQNYDAQQPTMLCSTIGIQRSWLLLLVSCKLNAVNGIVIPFFFLTKDKIGIIDFVAKSSLSGIAW